MTTQWGKKMDGRTKKGSLEGLYCPPEGVPVDFTKRQGDIISCKMCDYKSGNHNRIKEHTTKMHTGVNYFLCLGCQETFATKRLLQRHIREEHPTADAVEDANSSRMNPAANGNSAH